MAAVLATYLTGALRLRSPSEEIQRSPRLPVEIFVLIAEFLRGDDCLATVANLNVTSRVVHRETASALYDTVYIPWEWLSIRKVNGTTVKPPPPPIPCPEYVK